MIKLDNSSSISADAINEIISLDHDPVLRNLKITQCYYDLSQGLAARLGSENANWCTFATWASKTAGRFIRMENVNIKLHECLHLSVDYNKWLLQIQERYNELQLNQDFWHANVHSAALNCISLISADIAAGNLRVFSELGPVFSAVILALDESGVNGDEARSKVMAALRPGATADDGQELLYNAIADFYAARHQTDSRYKAELMLRANAQIGLHEQIRLQSYIAGALEAPLPHSFSRDIQKRAAENIPEHKHHILHQFLQEFITPVEHIVNESWLFMSTHYLMTLAFPDEILHLGHDLPNPVGAPLFPDQLLNPQDAKLQELLLQYHAHNNSPLHSHSDNWAHLECRMHYILSLFRSRQQHKPLFEMPFDEIKMAAILQNQVPQGRL